MSILDLLLNKLGYVSKKEHDTKVKHLLKLNSMVVEERNRLIKKLKDRPELNSERRTGNTTRLADWYIQELFTKGEIKVQDHYYNPNNRQPSIMLYRIIVDRLYMEHRWIKDKIKLDRKKLTIQFID